MHTRFPSPDEAIRKKGPRAAELHLQLGETLMEMRRFQESEDVLRKAIADLELQSRERGLSNWASLRSRESQGHGSLGRLLRSTGRAGEAEEHFRRALDRAEELAANYPDTPGYQEALAWRLMEWGYLMGDTGRHGEAENAYRRSLAIAEALSAADPDVVGYRHVQVDTGMRLLYLLENKPRGAQEAEPLYPRYLALAEKLVSEHPDSPEYREHWGYLLRGWGGVLHQVGRPQEAEAAFRRALQVHEGLDDRENVFIDLNQLGNLLKEIGRSGDAEAALRRALAVAEELATQRPEVATHRRQVAAVAGNLSILLVTAGRVQEAEPILRRSLELSESLIAAAPKHREYRTDLGKGLAILADLLRRAGKHPEAETAYRRLIDHQERLTADYPEVRDFRHRLAEAHLDLAIMLHDSGRDAEVEEHRRRGLAIFEKSVADFPKETADRRCLASYLANDPDPGRRDPDRAIALLERVAELAPRDRVAWRNLGVARYRGGQVRAAIAALEKALSLPGDADAEEWFFLALAHLQTGERAQALSWLGKATRWMEQRTPRDNALRRLHAEATTLLGLADLPADVFARP
jgi:tetratricopeptide (TPR) repeat protein